VAAATLAGARNSLAMGAIVGSSPGASEPAEVRIAVASTGTRTSRWVSLRVHGTGTTFAWIVPVKPGAFADLASDAWLESLEDATAPRVVPPDLVPPCGFAGGVEVVGDLSHVATTSPDSVAVATDVPALVTTLAAWGLAMPGDLAPLVDQAGASGDSFVALRYTSGPGAEVVTRTLRIVDASPPDVALAMMRASAPVAVTAYAFTTGPASFGSRAVAIDPSLLLWRATGGSTYAGVRDTLLSSNPGSWLVETSGHSPVFAGEAGGIDALSSAYFARAVTYGDTAESAGSCAANAGAWAGSLSTVAAACPTGALANVGGATCQEVAGAGEIAPDVFRCGGIADDLALALSGLGPGSTWVSRARGVLAPGAFGSDDPVAATGTASESTGPVVTCAGYDQVCGTPGGGSIAPAGSSSTSSSSVAGDPGTAGGAGGSTADPGAGAAAAADIAGAALDNSDGCGSDSSSSSDGCGGSSSSSDGSSSSSSDSCGSGSSSGGESGSSSGDSCSGGDSSNCSVVAAPARSRAGRSPVSRIGLLLVAFAALARRGNRPSRRGSRPPV
jgi:hypothetical protein